MHLVKFFFKKDRKWQHAINVAKYQWQRAMNIVKKSTTAFNDCC